MKKILWFLWPILLWVTMAGATEIDPANTKRATYYNQASAQIAKWLLTDGSVVDQIPYAVLASVVDPANTKRATMYKQTDWQVAKWLLPDGSIVDKMPVDSAGGGGCDAVGCTFTASEWRIFLELVIGVDVQAQLIYSIGTVAGTDTYTATAAPTLSALADKQIFYGIFTNANTSATPTLNITSKGAKTIVKNGTSPLVAGDIAAGGLYILEYDGTYIRLLNPKATQTTVVDALTSTSSTSALSAGQGKVLNDGKVPVPSASITDGKLLVKDGTGTDGKFKEGGTPITYTEPATNLPLCRTGAATTGACTNTLDGVKKIASFAWDGGGSAVATAGSKRCVAIPHASTIKGYTMVISGDPGAGGTILNITKDAYSDSALPTTEIDASAPPTVVDDKVAATDSTLTGWTTAVTANDIICADVATNAVATWISLTIYGTD